MYVSWLGCYTGVTTAYFYVIALIERLPEKFPKTMLMIGGRSAGKSTMVDALVNYALGGTWEDRGRFTIIDNKKEKASSICL